ncbi:guanine nucleotide exchange factor synembryn domain-containing protein [Ditylenchus destructor]|uniref:Guanine nucleotide exchange factor synembryn domain-containing protein n=1 Tax=Ditylenchus destructor TaxID=166010 RepID=A0AAD4N861_9BILA|nr:guanine nucleotide exchange factor synembryn domain-containing protein [Ditylenchus destructor]
MVPELDISHVNNWAGKQTSILEQIEELKLLHQTYADRFSFPEIGGELKENLVAYITNIFDQNADIVHNCGKESINELRLLLLGLMRMLTRDKKCSDLPCFARLASVLVKVAHLTPPESTPETEYSVELTMEAEKSLINVLFNSANARSLFETDALDYLPTRIAICAVLCEGTSKEKLPIDFSYLANFSPKEVKDLLFFDLKIAFVTSAQMPKVQDKWVAETKTTNALDSGLKAAMDILARDISNISSSTASPIEAQIGSEALKVLFNVYCHAKLFDLEIAGLSIKQCVRIILFKTPEGRNPDWLFELKQNAVNLLAILLPGSITEGAADLCCPKLTPKEVSLMDASEVHEDHDMHFTAALLSVFEQAIDKFTERSDLALLGTFFTVLINLCSHSKEARRYCRLKVLPPLTAKEVEHAPESGSTLRNKIVRLIQNASGSNCHELAAEFLFVLCKRSVNRLIKYCGFGHSAGLLANNGLLGAATRFQRKQSDSEDSDTEDYRGVEEKINPVTGFIPSQSREETLREAFASMSDEQKEYEAMKLVDAISKLMDEGHIAPATIGEDGRPKKVEHVAELAKDAKEEEPNSDED